MLRRASKNRQSRSTPRSPGRRKARPLFRSHPCDGGVMQDEGGHPRRQALRRRRVLGPPTSSSATTAAPRGIQPRLLPDSDPRPPPLRAPGTDSAAGRSALLRCLCSALAPSGLGVYPRRPERLMPGWARAYRPLDREHPARPLVRGASCPARYTPVAAGLVEAAEDWRGSSAGRCKSFADALRRV